MLELFKLLQGKNTDGFRTRQAGDSQIKRMMRCDPKKPFKHMTILVVSSWWCLLFKALFKEGVISQ